MTYVETIFPINAETFTYTVPESLTDKLHVGSKVIAPFGDKTQAGVVFSISQELKEPKSFEIKNIIDIPDKTPLIPPSLIHLINWLKEYYLCSLGIALKTALPGGALEGKKQGKTKFAFDETPQSSEIIQLNDEQQKALKMILAVKSGAILIHGVTGSGKTEVYMEAIAALPPDRQGLVLVPEIALTPQIIKRFQRRFGQDVAFFHSGLSAGEKITQWHKMRSGKAKVALGVRAAVFAPLPKLGLIVVDEEHEASYKQSDGLRYSARDTALVRAKFEGVKIILGSATPSIESFYNAQNGKFLYLTLKKRVNAKPLPDIEILDLKKEDKESTHLASKLYHIIKAEHEKGRQSILMLNRRGYSPFYMCSDCGFAFKCRHCSVTLTYHKDKNHLRCHYCGVASAPVTVCPKCRGHKIAYIGAGTQKIEEELSHVFQNLTVKRMDRDTTTRKLAHQNIVKDMESGAIHLLLGTQMVAKGHDFPDVTVAAVLIADVGLNLPDFRSGERAFQLFTQLAGRAGRGDEPGKVYIQTYNPDHYVFEFVKNYDYQGLYKLELDMRKELAYPPFGKLIRIIVSFKEKPAGKQADSDSTKKWDKDSAIKDIFKHTSLENSHHVKIVGPSPAPIEKLKDFWRWHLLLKGDNAASLRARTREILASIKQSRFVKVGVDVDPVEML
jgi:primosomal protein N' (replication factor Y)